MTLWSIVGRLKSTWSEAASEVVGSEGVSVASSYLATLASSVLSYNRSASFLARSLTLASLNEPDLLFTILVKVKARRVSSLKDSPAGRPKVSLLWFVADHLPR